MTLNKYLLFIAFAFITPILHSNSQNVKYKLDFHTFYNQFYITSDGGKAMTPEADRDMWNESAYNERLFSFKNFLAVRTESYGHIKGELFVLDKEKAEIDYSKYGHIVEAGVDAESGILQILDCPNSSVELELKVKPGRYRVRIYSCNMAGYDSDEKESNDFYKVEIWPDKNIERKVLKQYIKP